VNDAARDATNDQRQRRFGHYGIQRAHHPSGERRPNPKCAWFGRIDWDETIHSSSKKKGEKLNYVQLGTISKQN
jgi:hypothetical protein